MLVFIGDHTANKLAIGVFQTYYETGPLSNYSPSSIAWIPSLEVFMMFSGGPIWGKVDI